LEIYTNPKIKYKGNLNKNRQRWTKTCKCKGLLMKGCSRFWSRPKASNLSTMTMSLERIMNSRSNMVYFR
jgi:hypothetical protein